MFCFCAKGFESLHRRIFELKRNGNLWRYQRLPASDASETLPQVIAGDVSNLDCFIHALRISTFLNVQSVNETFCSFKVGHCTVGDILRWCCGTFFWVKMSLVCSVVFIKLD